MSLDSTFNKLKLLGPGACYDTCGPKDMGVMGKVPGIYEAKIAGGHICRIFKVLQTNVCKNNCTYCAHRRDNDLPRTTVSPVDMAQAFMQVYQHKMVEGLFLSSGVAGSSEMSMTRLIETTRLLRLRYNYLGYIHLKVMPGVSKSLLEQSVMLADRVSLNLEVPDAQYAPAVSPEKDFHQDLLNTLSQLKIARDQFKSGTLSFGNQGRWRQRRRGYKKRFGKAPFLTTQFVVGAAGETDLELVRATQQLQRNYGLYRVFFSALRPVLGTPLETNEPTPAWRQHRLYQAEWLLREYGFGWDEIPVDSQDHLWQDFDPKEAWAKANPEFFPIDTKAARYEELLRIPGVGPVTAKRLSRGERVKLFSKSLPYIRSESWGQLGFW